MTVAESEQHIDTESVRGGSTPHSVRYVLLISLTLVVIIFAIIVALRA